jgi:hypothetical protein
VLDGVATVAGDGAWAVGFSHTADSSHWAPLAERFRTGRWKAVATAKAWNGSRFSGVTALSSSDVWAVGTGAPPGDPVAGTLTEHFDGSAWTLVPSPDPGSEINTLAAVAAAAPDDVWAVGSTSDDRMGTDTLIEHWDGSAWSVVPSPDGVSFGENDLAAIGVVSPSDVWAVGWTFRNGVGYGDLIEHWDGAAWALVAGPRPGGREREILGVAAVTTSRVWAVGYRLASQPNYATMIDRWNGSGWRKARSPSPGAVQNFLAGASTIPGTNAAWAVGHRFDGGGPSTTLIERSC